MYMGVSVCSENWPDLKPALKNKKTHTHTQPNEARGSRARRQTLFTRVAKIKRKSKLLQPSPDQEIQSMMPKKRERERDFLLLHYLGVT